MPSTWPRCPHCGSRSFFRSRPRGPGEYLCWGLTLACWCIGLPVYVGPLRCLRCCRRWRTVCLLPERRVVSKFKPNPPPAAAKPETDRLAVIEAALIRQAMLLENINEKLEQLASAWPDLRRLLQE